MLLLPESVVRDLPQQLRQPKDVSVCDFDAQGPVVYGILKRQLDVVCDDDRDAPRASEREPARASSKLVIYYCIST